MKKDEHQIKVTEKNQHEYSNLHKKVKQINKLKNFGNTNAKCLKREYLNKYIFKKNS